MWLFEINDARVRVFNNDDLLYDQPGIALCRGNEHVFGTQALRQFMVHPANCYSHHWQKLNNDPVEPKIKGISSQAELVFQHLVNIKETVALDTSEPIWFAVPSDTTAEQLGVLYGVLNKAELAIQDFVDAAVAVSTTELPATCNYIDITLSRLIVSEIENTETIAVTGTTAVPQTGLLSFMNRWMGAVVSRSLEESRFNPRTFGSTEQQVFNALYEHIGHTESLDFEVKHNNEQRRMSISHEELAAASQPLYERLVERLPNSQTHLVLNHEVLALPQIEEFLTSRGFTVLHCTQYALQKALGAVPQIDLTNREDRAFHRTFAHLSQRIRSPVNLESKASRATHVLRGNLATGIDGEFLGVDVATGASTFRLINDHSTLMLHPHATSAVHLNGMLVTEPRHVALGDIIVCGNSEYRLITTDRDG